MDTIDYIMTRDEAHAVYPTGDSHRIRILVVDDRPDVREALRMRLAAESDMTVIGEAPDGEVALAMAMSGGPDVVLMDVEMPLMDGLATTYALRAACPHARIVMLSIHDDAPTLARATEAGAVAFVAKSLPPEVLLITIRRVFREQSG